MTGTQSRFSTFCHISEYTTETDDYSAHNGYHNLHRMIATSYPLNLWSPSSVFLRKANCRVSPEDFVGLLEDGYLRVLGRRHWITNRGGYRTDPAGQWEGLRWDDHVDGAILAIHRDEERAGVPDAERRVVVTADERGYEVAREMVARDRTYVDELYQAYERGPGYLPHGTRETVLKDLLANRHGDDVPRDMAVAMSILRDAHNHAAAAADSGAEAPFLLNGQDSTFMRLLADLPGPRLTPSGEELPSLSYPERERLAELTRQVIALLRDLDILRARDGALREDRNVRNWVGSEGHQLMVAWLHDLSVSVARVDREDLDGYAARQLREDVVESVLTLGGVDLATLPTGRGLVQELGYVPADYPGEQWPYLYLYREHATLERARRLYEMLTV